MNGYNNNKNINKLINFALFRGNCLFIKSIIFLTFFLSLFILLRSLPIFLLRKTEYCSLMIHFGYHSSAVKKATNVLSTPAHTFSILQLSYSIYSFNHMYVNEYKKEKKLIVNLLIFHQYPLYIVWLM